MFIDVTGFLLEPGMCDVGIVYSKGAHGLNIFDVALLADDKIISQDAHEGFTGWSNRDNIYRINFPKRKLGAHYQLRITAAASGGTDSYGQIFISRLKNDPAVKKN